MGEWVEREERWGGRGGGGGGGGWIGLVWEGGGDWVGLMAKDEDLHLVVLSLTFQVLCLADLPVTVVIWRRQYTRPFLTAIG